jgi:cellulose synthase/poly-beta-1,6-N-acetylglucosamine synthase-like glycosyltransferase
MEATVIIPAYNAATTLGECLSALNAQTVERDRYEVIVVDDGSHDATSDVAAEHGARLVRQQNAGQAAARNHGVQDAQGAIVAFTDADCAPAPTWLAEMVAPFADAGIAGTKGVYRTRQRSLAARFAQIEYEERYAHMRRVRYIDFVDTYAAAYRRNVFLDNGGFDTSFPGDSSGEDQELSFRLAERGYKMVFVPSAIVFHRHPPTVAAYARRKYKTGYWKALVLRLHPRKAVRDTHTPASLKAQMALVALTLPVIVIGAALGLVLPFVVVMAILLAASYAPFTIQAWRKDRAVGLVSPFLLTVRAVALGTGLLMGIGDAGRRAGPLVSRLPPRNAAGRGHG